MAFSQVSARDPIFYRWHGSIENIVQRWRDQNQEKYKKADLEVDDDLEMKAISTTMMHKEHKLTDRLVTHMEDYRITIRDDIFVHYKRMNYVDFKWKLEIKNPQRSKKKVMIRIFLAAPRDAEDIK